MRKIQSTFDFAGGERVVIDPDEPDTVYTFRKYKRVRLRKVGTFDAAEFVDDTGRVQVLTSRFHREFILGDDGIWRRHETKELT